MSQAIMFLSNFKLGHCMKIPPKSMFVVQLVGTLVASSVYFGPHGGFSQQSSTFATDPSSRKGAPGLVPFVFYSASIIWGPPDVHQIRCLPGDELVLPVWMVLKKYPEKKRIQLINMPIVFGATMSMPTARAVNYITWAAVGLFFNAYIYSKYKEWWARHTYILSAALDAGVAFMGVAVYFALQSREILGPAWWGLVMDDHRPLAICPTAPGIQVKGCPVL